MKAQVRKAFTLVEILIVVVILGILAAIVVPQFTNASEDAMISNIQSQLQTIRSQIELYRVKEGGTLPAAGAAATLFDDGVLVGPDYLRSAPVNPRTGTSSVAQGVEADVVAATTGVDPAWFYDATTGGFWANGFDEAAGTWVAAP